MLLVTSCQAQQCSSFHACDTCVRNTSCGWCPGATAGVGTCMLYTSTATQLSPCPDTGNFRYGSCYVPLAAGIIALIVLLLLGIPAVLGALWWWRRNQRRQGQNAKHADRKNFTRMVDNIGSKWNTQNGSMRNPRRFWFF
ncbi:hypothetical protein SeMB42_g03717 [Synchytrium endobioticum]|uniref:PSI domain-containing protein n=1 Tax=Synchytrium endobioticum TaxID=286115 RepID=A0A507D4H5_9FUNG|nr:hypothetical protein SeMB42_g03717 [Synchytrium endobioticum]